MWLFSKNFSSDVQLKGKTVLITGANTGIGKAAAEELYKKGARVLMACRSEEKATVAIENIKATHLKDKNVGDLVFVQLNLSSFDSIRKCANHITTQEKQIDVLINNAGIYCCPKGKTEDGFETQFGVNHLGHFLFTLLLLPKLIASKKCRIINVSSNFHKGADLQFDDINYEKRRYSAITAYNTSKLCNILFTKELAKRLEEQGIKNVTVYAPHPGFVHTDIPRHLNDTYGYGTLFLWKLWIGWWILTPKQGAQTILYCAVDDTAGSETGLYYNNCKSEIPAKNALNYRDAKKLWEMSINFCNLNKYNPFQK